MTGGKILSLCLAAILCFGPWQSVDGVQSSCPWEEQDLLLWSDPLTWDSGQVPQDGEEVFVTKRVLLDTSASLANLTVNAGGAVIWGNVPDLVLRATYIRVFGEFRIGNDDCRFQHKATIKLYGRPDSIYEAGHLGRKFLGVEANGVLEIHGQEKLPWTRLAHTIPDKSAAIAVECAVVYNHTETPYDQETKDGMHVVIWQPDGRLYDFSYFDETNWDTVADFVNVNDGMVIAASVYKNLGVSSETFNATMESLGAQKIRNIEPNQMYAFIVKKGDVTSAVEKLADVSESETGYIHLPDFVRDLDFCVSSTSSDVDFIVFNGDYAFPIISVADDVSSWKPGDEIFVTSTDYDWRQLEVRRILECDKCNANQIRLDAPFEYMHYGEVTKNIDQRAEVGLLTRNILIVGELEETCDIGQTLCARFGMDTYGGHTKAMRGSTIHIQGVELYHMGQQENIAAYPLHFHMMDDASGMWFRNNSIHHSLSRCITIHATDNVDVSDNVCYHHLGHGFFLEDGVEQNNTLDRNLGVGTLYGNLIMSDRKSDWCADEGLEDFCDFVSTFWLTHPNNVVINNVAAGSEKMGFMYVFADSPLGPSAYRQKILGKVLPNSVQYYPVKRFSNNVAHSNYKAGLFFDHEISANESKNGVLVPENGVIPHAPTYDPRDPPNATGEQVWTTMDTSTFYKNRRQNAWVKARNIQVVNCSFADSLNSYGGGNIAMNTGIDTGNKVKDSVFVAKSDNTGMPTLWTDFNHADKPSFQFDYSIAANPYETVAGVVLSQGPMIVENCYFEGFAHEWWANEWLELYGVRGVTPRAAISFPTPTGYPVLPFTMVRELKFGFCDNINGGNWVFLGNSSLFKWEKESLKGHLTFRDADGSLTGQAGAYVVPNRPFYTGPECYFHDNWGMSACPYKYIEVFFLSTDGVLDTPLKSQYPLTITRDDARGDPFNFSGERKNLYALQTFKSYTVRFNETLGPVPTVIKIDAFGMDRGDEVRMALCLPKTTTEFRIRNDNPLIDSKNPPVMASSVAEVDSDTVGNVFYWDSTNGLLYFKITTNYTRQRETEECPNGFCYTLKIFRENGESYGANCSDDVIPPFQDTRPAPSVPQPAACPSELPTSDGMGALNPANIVTVEPVPMVCHSLDPQTDRTVPVRMGCMKDRSKDPLMTEFTQQLPKSMTQSVCIDRCYQRGFKYAGLKVGKECSCANIADKHGPSADPCDEPCRGDLTQTCGGATQKSIEVFSTGLP